MHVLQLDEVNKARVPPSDLYSAAIHFGGVTDWYQEPRYCHVGFEGFHSHLHGGIQSIWRYVRHRISESRWTTRDASDIGSLGVDGPSVMPEDPYAYVVAAFQALPSPGYVPSPEYPPSPDFVLEPVYSEFMPPEDEVLPTEEQPLPAAVSPTADSPDYVPESDPEEDPEEDDDEDPEEDHVDYPADRGDDGDDEDESSDDDEDDDVDIEGDEEEEEHLAPADSTTVALLVIDQAPSAEEAEPFETDESAATPPPHLAYRVTARILIRDEPPTPFWSDTEVARLLVIPTPPSSSLSPWSSPLPHIPSPPLPLILSLLPLSPPLPISSPSLPASPIYPLGYQAAMIRLRADTPSLGTPPSGTPPLLPILLPTSSPPLHLLSTDHRADRPERDVGYRITDTWDEMPVDMPGSPATDDTKLGRRMTKFTTRVRQDTDKIYTRLDDEQSERQLMAGRLNILYMDRRAHAQVMSLRTEVVAQQAVITELQAVDRRRQAAITEMLAADHRRQAHFIEALKLMKRLQTQMTEFERQQGPAKGPAQPDAPEEAGSSS
ncbi:hypothetical protein Tco_0789294 [Tanacetum coccineum]